MFTPILPGTSLASWQYLKDSRATQVETLSRDAVQARDRKHFEEAITKLSSVDDLMKDYQSLKVALGAHGLQEDLPNRYFVRQVIEQGTQSETAFANRLSDARYTALARTFEDLGLTGSGDLRDSPPQIAVDVAKAVTERFGESPIYLKAASRLDGALSLGLLGADTADKLWTRAASEPALLNSLSRMLGVSSNVASLDAGGQVRVLSEATDYLYGSPRLGTLIDPANAFDAADRALGTSGQALEDAFSYTGLADRLGAIFTANPVSSNANAATQASVDDSRWAALQADTALRDVVASVVGVPSDFESLTSAEQITALKDGTEALFGRDSFSVFSVQANQQQIGDLFLDPGGGGLGQVFTLGAFTEAVTEVRSRGASTDEKWQSALKVDTFREGLKDAFGLGEDFEAMTEAEQIETLKAETRSRYDSEEVDVFKNARAMADLTGLYMDAQVSQITQSYTDQEFRVAVGEVRPELRVALSVAEELQKAVDTGGTEAGQWYRVLGNNVLRETFETAFGLSSDFASGDLDAQMTTMRDMAEDRFGTNKLSDFLSFDTQDKLIREYLGRAGTTDATSSNATVSLFTTASAGSILSTIYGL